MVAAKSVRLVYAITFLVSKPKHIERVVIVVNTFQPRFNQSDYRILKILSSDWLRFT